MIILRLYFEFFKIGLFAVGGGLATLPFLSKLGTATGWFTQSQLADMVAVSESTPGPMGVNMATYVGFTTAGIPGSLAATIGLTTPSIIIIIIIAAFLKNFRDNQYVNGVFRCLRPASTGLIAASGLSVAAVAILHTNTGRAVFDWRAILLAVALLVLTRGIKKTKGLHPIVWIGLSALVGILFFPA
ncbi:MAG: chromate transporter [Oscillospiraceae bacterium]|jgi:chromate transporter|nr:chromate transporter [Oscillospiraceae bacterium]MDD3261919.1 chromate transporter [Oscillospiraceae bacterium]